MTHKPFLSLEWMDREFPSALTFLGLEARGRHVILALPHRREAEEMIADCVAGILEAWEGWPRLHNLSRMSPEAGLAAAEDLVATEDRSCVAILPPVLAGTLEGERMHALLSQDRVVLVVPVLDVAVPEAMAPFFGALAVRQGGGTIFRTRGRAAGIVANSPWQRIRATAGRLLAGARSGRS